MPSFLLCVGNAAERSLPVVFSALSCGAALPVSLHVFSLLSGQSDRSETVSLAADLTACHQLMQQAGESAVFPSGFSLDSCIPVFRSVADLSEDPGTALLLSALRGKGLPFSCQTDREAVEWCFADLLSRPEDPSVQPFLAWLASVESQAEQDPSLRLTVMADLSDPFSAGIALVLLPLLRQRLSSAFISLIAFAETASPLPDSFFPSLSSALQAIDDRSLLRRSDEETPAGADALWLLSLPSSMVETPASHSLPALAAARVLGLIHAGENPPPVGFHTREIDGTLSLASLGDQAASFAAFCQSSVWLLTDLIPALRNYLSHPARFRSLAPNAKNSLFRMLFSAHTGKDFTADLSLLESTLKTLLSGILSFLRSIPAAFRLSAENASAWQDAVSACGRYITVASELDVSAAEARESGLDTVRPVHRVSLADTEEELLARRLQDMEQQLKNESGRRETALAVLGGYRALQVRLDCLSRCQSALADARKQTEVSSEGEEHLTLLKRARRVRLLEAAVARCTAELAPSAIRTDVSALPKTKTVSDPYACSPFSEAACRALEAFLNSSGTDTAPRIPPIFTDPSESVPKQRMKALQTACHGDASSAPLPYLCGKVLQVCREEVSSFRFLSPDGMPSVYLLPDIISSDPLLRIRDVLARLPGASGADSGPEEERGLLAMLLLRQYRRRLSSEAALVCDCCDASSPVLRYWLSVHGADKACIFSLSSGEVSLPFALVLPGRSFRPARRISAHAALVPSFVTWFDSESGSFTDPCIRLGEGDRKLLLELLSSCLSAMAGAEDLPLFQFLQSFRQDLAREREPYVPDTSLETRIRAACGLSALSAYESALTKVSCFYEHFLTADQLCACLSGKESFTPSTCLDIPEEVLYLYRGVPFAREDSRLLLDSPHASGEEYSLKRLREECALLSESSDDYRDSLLQCLPDLLARYPSVLPEIRDAAEAVLDQAQEPVERREPCFTWPWDPKSPSIRTVIQESLGAEVTDAALSPFSDGLAVFPARGRDVIGDTLLSSMCAVFPQTPSDPETAAVAPDAVLPPLSASFGRVLCLLPEGRTLLKPGMLSFERLRNEPAASDSFRVTLTLDGVFPVRFVRVYAPEEIFHLYAHDIPTVALWPSVPFRPEDWHAYYVYAHITPPYTVSVLAESGVFSDPAATSEGRFTAVLDTFPVCFAFSSGDKTIGILPNVLPRPLLPDAAPVEICVDFGSSGTSVVFASGRQRNPMHGPVMVRTLLNNPSVSKDLLRREFLPAVPVSALLPTVTRLFRNVPGAAPVPFADGIILMSSDLGDLLSTPSDAIYTSLKWEEEKGRSGFLCLHQVMLMAALQARFEGASSLSWRFAIPDEMAKEGRESLMKLFLSLSESVLRESGYPLSLQGLPVSFASESSALGAYFRYCASDDTRGGFMVLDLGACTADISLFMRGREQAVRACQIPLGIHYMLLPSLLRDPDLPAREFGFCTDETFRRDLSLLCRALSAARTDSVALRRARVALDYFLADHLSMLISLSLQLASAGQPTRVGAVLLLHLAFLMMLSGLVLLQIAADPNKNDFLPEQMSLCLSGRGSAIFEALPPQLKTSLWHFLSMFRNRRVSSLSLLFSAEKKMEIPVGLSMLREVWHMLPPASAVPASIAVRPAELLPEFLLRFRREFPSSAELLFPGFFTNDYYHPFSDRGESLISASVDHSFPPSDTPRPYDSLSAWIGNLLELVQMLG